MEARLQYLQGEMEENPFLTEFYMNATIEYVEGVKAFGDRVLGKVEKMLPEDPSGSD